MVRHGSLRYSIDCEGDSRHRSFFTLPHVEARIDILDRPGFALLAGEHLVGLGVADELFLERGT
jgi:hypothetical protein